MSANLFCLLGISEKSLRFDLNRVQGACRLKLWNYCATKWSEESKLVKNTKDHHAKSPAQSLTSR